MATAFQGEAKGEAVEVKDADESTTTAGGVLPANFAEVIPSLRLGPSCPLFPPLRLYRGFWVPEFVLQKLPELHARFEARPTDVLLASFPKCGTTWLKALCYAAARRSEHSPLDEDHPLLRKSSHDCVKFIDALRFLEDDDGDDAAAPRLFATHLPYSLLPRQATMDGGSGCRIVYITRDPKDTLVSLLHFIGRAETATGPEDGGAGRQPEAAAIEFEEAFELFSQGCYLAGPQWEHAREYWEAGERRPEQVLCLRYEEMLQDPAGNLKRIAEFMGCPFSAAEEEAGVVRAVVDLCRLERQRGVAANMSGAYVGATTKIDNKRFFRKGVVGDWKNHMSPEMAARLDGIVEEALKGSGFSFLTSA